ncbi:hypothetical protein [Methylobacterium sp. J-030]|uniref:hypothetical protein n=1 Tax=Methylobacterium sp. J-030 TaxID=2836627 RepID=UPI0028C4A0A1|nr:hypothetical protein [Methylobacterium sp. J-030]
MRMAIAMQKHLGRLNARWRRAGIARPFQARIGIDTGDCNVGHFGSDERMAARSSAPRRTSPRGAGLTRRRAARP